MRIVYFLGWCIATALFCYYMYSRTLDTSNGASHKSHDDIEIVDETESSAQNNTDSGMGEDADDSNSTASQTSILGESPEEQKISGSADRNNLRGIVEIAFIEFPRNDLKLKVDDPNLNNYLDSLAQVLNTGGYKVELVGHTDSSQGDVNNYEIGLARAEFVRELLNNRNVDDSVIAVESKGDTEPRMEGDSLLGPKKDRRVEIYLRTN